MASRSPSALRNGTVEFSKFSPPAKATSTTATRPSSGGGGRFPGCSTNTTRTGKVIVPRGMQNLRDKLLKAGLVTEKQANEAERGQREPRKHREREAKESAEEKQRREAFAAREAELAGERRKEAAKVAEARMQSERARRLRQLGEWDRVAGRGGLHF